MLVHNYDIGGNDLRYTHEGQKLGYAHPCCSAFKNLTFTVGHTGLLTGQSTVITGSLWSCACVYVCVCVDMNQSLYVICVQNMEATQNTLITSIYASFL